MRGAYLKRPGCGRGRPAGLGMRSVARVVEEEVRESVTSRT